MKVGDKERLQLELARYARGYRDAFPAVFELLWPTLRAFVAHALENPSDAEDAAQEALLKVFARISDFRPGTDPISWSLAIASFEVLSARKRSNRRREDHLEAGQLVREPRPSADEALLEVERQQLLHAALASLGADDRNVLLVTNVGPMAPALRKRKQRALDRLRSIWRSLNGAD